MAEQANSEILLDLAADYVDITRFETTTAKVAKSVSFETGTEGRNAAWLKAALKESLGEVPKSHSLNQSVMSKYFLSNHCIRIEDHIYRVKQVQMSDKYGIVERMSGIHLTDVYQMDWRTTITFEKDRPTTSSTYSSLGGLEQQIALIRQLLELPLQHPETFRLFGLTPPRGILLFGPPGTGKTALARAVASSTPGCSCVVVNGPELSSSFHGETEERLRGVFAKARRQSPCVIVLDEVDALCPRRDGDGGEVEKRVVATLLTLMDGMDSGDERVFVIAATNRPNSIDPALRRPGRFDREIEIGRLNPYSRLCQEFQTPLGVVKSLMCFSLKCPMP